MDTVRLGHHAAPDTEPRVALRLMVGAFRQLGDFNHSSTAIGERHQHFGPRAGFAYSLNDRTVVRGGYGKYFADVTGQPAVFTLRNVQQITPQILNDGRPDFASNPFNGPAPTYDQASRLLCSVNPIAGCLRPNLGNFVANDLAVPYSHQASIGLQRQLGDVMSVEADYVYTGRARHAGRAQHQRRLQRRHRGELSLYRRHQAALLCVGEHA